MLHSLQLMPFTKTLSGSMKFGDQADSDWTNSNFESGDDYDVLVQGNGFYDPTSKTATGFDFTVTSGTVIFWVMPRKVGAIAQVS